MRIFSKVLPMALIVAFLASASVASEGGIYDKDLVRGFLALKGDFRYIKSDGVKLINTSTGQKFASTYVDGHVEIGAEYLQLRTWFDIDFMPLTPERGNSEWFSYGVTWMWGYKILSPNSFFNIIPSAGPGIELMNIRSVSDSEIASSFGPTLNLELELRLQWSQFSVGLYGGYKVIRHYGWDDLTNTPAGWPTKGDINADRAFAGLKFSWTMLNSFQKRGKDLF